MKALYALRILLCVTLFSIIITKSKAQSSETWTEIQDTKSVVFGDRSGMPKEFKVFRLDLNAMKNLLNHAVIDSLPGAYASGPVIAIPLPDGSFRHFRIAYTPVMEPALAAQLPMIKTFTGVGVEDPSMIVRLDYTLWGFHAMIISVDGWYIIDPVALGNTSEYMTFNRSSSVPAQPFICGTTTVENKTALPNEGNVYRSSGPQLRTYRLALSCTGEYAAFYGGTVAGAASGMATSVSRVTQVYESELAIRLVLVANNNSLIYLNANGDPFTNNNGGTMLTQNQTVCDGTIGSANYDIGHVFSTGGGGVAYLGCVCGSNKAGGVTGSGAPIGDNFDIDYVAHEMGHQFGGNHTFNSVTGSCSGGNRAASAAYEPGSGTTIMAYAGICGADDIQPHSDPIFHTKSFDEIQIYTTTGNGSNCDVLSPTNNLPPTVTLPANYTIPRLTSFILTGSATDPNNDPLTYLWEEFDLGPSGSPNSPTLNAPLFRDFTPSSSPSRTFPKIQDIVRNTQVKGEILPSYGRSLTFRLTARDNKLNGAGVQHDDNVVTITVVNTTDTFKVTTPNTNITWFAGSANTVTWKVATTNVSPVSCANVNILLSIDSGYTFPYTLASNTPNDGTESITLPVVTSTKARIKVESVGNVFFDMSNVNFTIDPQPGGLTTITTSALATSNLCAGSTVQVPYTVNASAVAGNVFTAQLSNAAGSFASPVSIGTLTSTTAGTINATIPAGTAVGNGYRIRVVSSSPVVTGSDNGTNLTIFVSPAAAGIISGTSTVCAGQTGVVYSVPAIANATDYVWTIPANVNITSGSNTNSITVTFLSNASSGSITVVGKNNGCGNGTVSSPFSVTVNPFPGSPGTISGNTSVCPGQNGVAFSIPAISNVTGYNWSLPPGASIATGNNTNSITVNFSSSAVSGVISVMGSNTCGSVTSSSLNVNLLRTTSSINITPGGSTNICSGSGITLSYSPSGNSVYQWRKDGVNIAGQTGASYFANAGGTYDVIGDSAKSFSNTNRISIPDNSCTGASRTISVNGYTGTVTSSGISVLLNITHSFDGDLDIILQAPNGTLLGLSNQRGSSADNFTNTLFSDAGATVLPTTTTGAPFTGTYKPLGAFTSCVNPTLATFAAIGAGAINPNGTWTLYVYDRSASDTGSLINWTLNLPASVNSPCIKNSNQVTVSVTPSVTASVTIASNAGTTICQNTNVTFTATPSNGGASPSYVWQVNGSNVGTNNTGFSTSSLANGNIVRCIMTSNAACATNNPDTSNTITMTVNPNVNASVIISANPGTTICQGTNITFSATATNGGTTPSYQWRRNGSPVGTNSSSYANSSLNQGDIITCVMTSNASCVSGSPATSNALPVTVNPVVNASVGITASPSNSVCSGTNVTFTAAPVNGGSTPSYQWKIGSTNVGTNSPFYSNASLVNGNVISCVMTSNANCVSNAIVTSNTVTMTVNPNVTPTISISASPGDIICPGTNVTFTAQIGGSISQTFQWLRNGIGVGTNSSQYSNASLSDGDVIECKLTSNATCTTVNPVLSDPIVITVNPVITLNSFSPAGGNAGSQIQLNGTGFSTVTAVTFNGINAQFTIVNNVKILATVPPGNTTGHISIVGCGQATSANNFIRVVNVKLQLKVSIEGYQLGNGLMREVLGSGKCDSVQVSLAESISPNSLLVSDKKVIDATGNADFIFPGSDYGRSYYIVVSHRNTLQTWSSSPLLFSDSIMQYDFTTSGGQAFGNNLINVGGVYCMRSGDVNQDGVIDLLDISNITQSVEQFISGYLPQDLNGDSFAESADFSLIENNLSRVVARP